ncbi:hypothetical protein ACWGMA_11650 [Streptomyces asiaticus]
MRYRRQAPAERAELFVFRATRLGPPPMCRQRLPSGHQLSG